jgi:hypothetical protein
MAAAPDASGLRRPVLLRLETITSGEDHRPEGLYINQQLCSHQGGPA